MKKPTLCSLRRQIMTAESGHDRLQDRRIKILERRLGACSRLESRLVRRLEKTEKIVILLRGLLRKIRSKSRGKSRVNMRHVSHRLGRVEKAHLMRVWTAHRRNPKRLEVEGKKLAAKYDLDYQRQVMRWFRFFGNMSAAQKAAIRK